MKEPDFIVDGTALRLWSGCCVYAWKRGDEWLYIGSSSRGLSRPLNHSVINSVEEIQNGDSLEAWFFECDRPPDSLPAYLIFEAEMIRKHRPRYNVTDNPDRQPRLSKRQLVRLEEEKLIAIRRVANGSA